MRIITGKAKGLKLKTPAGWETRPTSDRVKESLFSILNGLTDFFEVESVLDIFAGTGALGLESLSRGAKSAIFIDLATANLISENVRRAKFEDVAKVFRGDFEKILKKLSQKNLQFDLIFSDPPYKKNLSQKTLELVAEFNLLKAEGFLIVEHGAEEILKPPEIFRQIKKVTYGKTTEIEIFSLLEGEIK